MQMLSKQVVGYIEKSSWIRKMFEIGIELKAQHGEDAVCDFSLGNPDLAPPPAVGKALANVAQSADKPFAFGYMPNPGYPFARKALAGHLSKEQGVDIGSDDVVITCGAAGALNAIMRAVLDHGDEVLSPAPYFVEYGFYTQNHGGVFTSVPAKPLTFELDLEAMAAAINPKTRIVLINSPNNPSGAVYTEDELKGLAAILKAKTEEYGRPIYLVADEPYRFLVFDGIEVPSILPLYDYAIAVSSFSKNLSLAGERVGYAVVAPQMPGKGQLLGGLILANRILGFVNAPAIGQKIMAEALGSQVNVTVYAERRKAMTEVLDAAGYNFSMPKGAFYFFPEAPGGDDVAFVAALQEELILAVPGTGFGCPGYFRLAFCVGEEVIRRSAAGFKKAYRKLA
ncbi:MAG: pyridoxal phosphate-dependent aminotransferase [Proteobacteria bacterium]|nr:pyridoxal phosphate-dependent aminotransferase [Pseudomonadota bacterium]